MSLSFSYPLWYNFKKGTGFSIQPENERRQHGIQKI